MKKKYNLPALGLLAAAVFTQNVSASVITEIESNNTIAAAQNIDANFSVGANADIANALTTPWVSITNASSNQASYDYFSFTVAAGATGVFDIDYGMIVGGSVDTELVLFGPSGAFLVNNDDAAITNGAGGSIHVYDAFLEYTFTSAGLYTIGVCEFGCSGAQGTMVGGMVDAGDTYTLQVSIQNHSVNDVPEPATLLLIGAGLAGMGFRRKRLA